MRSVCVGSHLTDLGLYNLTGAPTPTHQAFHTFLLLGNYRSVVAPCLLATLMRILGADRAQCSHQETGRQAGEMLGASCYILHFISLLPSQHHTSPHLTWTPFNLIMSTHCLSGSLLTGTGDQSLWESWKCSKILDQVYPVTSYLPT